MQRANSSTWGCVDQLHQHTRCRGSRFQQRPVWGSLLGEIAQPVLAMVATTLGGDVEKGGRAAHIHGDLHGFHTGCVSWLL